MHWHNHSHLPVWDALQLLLYFLIVSAVSPKAVSPAQHYGPNIVTKPQLTMGVQLTVRRWNWECCSLLCEECCYTVSVSEVLFCRTVALVVRGGSRLWLHTLVLFSPSQCSSMEPILPEAAPRSSSVLAKCFLLNFVNTSLRWCVGIFDLAPSAQSHYYLSPGGYTHYDSASHRKVGVLWHRHYKQQRQDFLRYSRWQKTGDRCLSSKNGHSVIVKMFKILKCAVTGRWFPLNFADISKLCYFDYCQIYWDGKGLFCALLGQFIPYNIR